MDLCIDEVLLEDEQKGVSLAPVFPGVVGVRCCRPVTNAIREPPYKP